MAGGEGRARAHREGHGDRGEVGQRVGTGVAMGMGESSKKQDHESSKTMREQ